VRIAFFGLKNSFDFYHIGGMDSLVRRLAAGLYDAGEKVGLVHYGDCEDKTVDAGNGIELHYFRSLAKALAHLEGGYDHVVSIYLRPQDRIAYARFRRDRRNQIRFHHVFSCWNESWVKRELMFADARLFPFNGTVFCLSQRLHGRVSKWSSRPRLLFPPVPKSYFIRPDDKSRGAKIRVMYSGRIDPLKGTEEATAVFRQLAGEEGIKASIYGYVWTESRRCMRLHGRLLSDPAISYETGNYERWSCSAEADFQTVLAETDILILPYRKLSSTVDTPLLLLEGMASLCAVIVPSVGDIPSVYGPGYCVLNGKWNTEKVVSMIKQSEAWLARERERLARHNASLAFDSESVTQDFRRSIVEYE